MNIILDDETLAAARAEINDTGLLAIIDRIVHDAKASDLWALTCIIVVDPAGGGDELESILGFDPLIGPLNDGAGEFIPWWDWLEHHPGWFELLITAGDSGFATFLLVPDTGADRSGLAARCSGNDGKVVS